VLIFSLMSTVRASRHSWLPVHTSNRENCIRKRCTAIWLALSWLRNVACLKLRRNLLHACFLQWFLPQCCLRHMCWAASQVYYQLSRIRQARRIRDVVLVRLEQLAPFPHDLVMRVRLFRGVHSQRGHLCGDYAA
jgi:2-oxoglutarate dehydrogenase C-terminal